MKRIIAFLILGILFLGATQFTSAESLENNIITCENSNLFDNTQSTLDSNFSIINALFAAGCNCAPCNGCIESDCNSCSSGRCCYTGGSCQKDVTNACHVGGKCCIGTISNGNLICPTVCP